MWFQLLKVRKEAKKKVFVTNAIRALRRVAPDHNLKNIPNVVLVGGSAEDFEIPEMLMEALAEYGHKLNLTFDEMDKVITQGKELGVYLYMFTGGEPLVRKADLVKLCEKHSDCAFLAFTNGTLVDASLVPDLPLAPVNLQMPMP